MPVVMCPKQAAPSECCLPCAFMQERERNRERYDQELTAHQWPWLNQSLQDIQSVAVVHFDFFQG